jgi:heptosyltransferase-2
MRTSHLQIGRILVRGTNWIGDAVMSLPALGRLRSSFPAAHITLLATPRTASLFESFTLIDEVLIYRRREEGGRAFVEMAATLRRRRFDLALLFQNAFEAALLACVARAPRRIGFAAQGRSLLLTHALKHTPEHRHRHQIYDYLDLVAAAERACLGVERQTEEFASHPPAPILTASPSQRASARALLERYQIRPGQRPLVALNAGATNSRAKCWPAERFAALADRLSDETGAVALLIGAASERAQAERVIAGLQRASAINLAGETSIGELIGVLDGCDLLVSNDTGPAHIAAALSRPTLTIFGPTNEFETAPTGPQAAILRAEGIECARCMLRDCPIDHRCMTRISSDEVAARALSLLRHADDGRQLEKQLPSFSIRHPPSTIRN